MPICLFASIWSFVPFTLEIDSSIVSTWSAMHAQLDFCQASAQLAGLQPGAI
jgi:hypothetical protein